MEILSDSSIDKTFETQSLSATGGIEESISDTNISSEKDHDTSFSDNVMGSRERTIKNSQSVSESEASQTPSASPAYSHHLGIPTDGASSISSSPSSDSSDAEVHRCTFLAKFRLSSHIVFLQKLLCSL